MCETLAVYAILLTYTNADESITSLVESFYSVKYGLSIITSNVRQIISVIKTKTLVFPKKLYFKNSSFWHFNSCFVLKHFFQITEKKTQTENQQLFDGIIDVTLFYRVGGLD